MGNKQQSDGNYAMEPEQLPTAMPRKSRHLSMEETSAEISLDANYMTTGEVRVNASGVATPTGTHQRRLTSTQFLGTQGDEAAVARTPRGHARKNTVPQQVIKFEKQSK